MKLFLLILAAMAATAWRLPPDAVRRLNEESGSGEECPKEKIIESSCDEECDEGCDSSCDSGISSCDASCDSSCDAQCDTFKCSTNEQAATSDDGNGPTLRTIVIILSVLLVLACAILCCFFGSSDSTDAICGDVAGCFWMTRRNPKVRPEANGQPA